MDNKRKQLILDVLKYYNYWGVPEITFYESFIEVKLFQTNSPWVSLYDYIRHISDVLHEAGIPIHLCIQRTGVITIKGMNTDEEAEVIYSILRIKGVLK